MRCFGLTDKGRVRSDNQDCFIIEKCNKRSCLIIGLCDGMGGANAGELASRMSNREFVSDIYAKLTSRTSRHPDHRKILTEACEKANSVAYEYSTFDSSCKGMGTTIVGGIILPDGACKLINVGDSRAYHINTKKREIYQITKDHSLVEELVEYGAITKEQAKTHPQRNVITRAVGSEEEIESDYYEVSLGPSDMLLLCSDGLSNVVSDIEMLEYACEYGDPELVCRSLMSKALNREARDNVTVVTVAR